MWLETANQVSLSNSLSPGHEVEEAVELDEAAAVGVDDGHDSLEVNFALEKIDASVKLARFGRKRCSLILA